MLQSEWNADDSDAKQHPECQMREAAVNDPMYGAIAENTNSKMGRYRPYILFGAPILVVLNCLTFTAVYAIPQPI